MCLSTIRNAVNIELDNYSALMYLLSGKIKLKQNTAIIVKNKYFNIKRIL